MLKYNLDETTFNTLDEAHKTLYTKGDNGYQLQVEGVVAKSKVDEFRNSNITLQEQLKKFDGVDLDKYNAALEADRKLRDKELIDKGDFETLFKERTATLESNFTAQIQTLTADKERLEGESKSSKIKQNINDAALAAFATSKMVIKF